MNHVQKLPTPMLVIVSLNYVGTAEGTVQFLATEQNAKAFCREGLTGGSAV